MPHYKMGSIKPTKVKRGPTYNIKDFTIGDILLYTVGNLICLGVVVYYLWFK